MKRLTLLIVAFLALLPVIAADSDKQPLEFATTSHDFGTIKADGGNVSFTYEFTNVSDQPVAIITVTNGGCGCTKPEYPRKPIAPGKTGKIKITFDPRGRRGELNREVKMRYRFNSKSQTVKLNFSGVIVP